MAVVTIGVSLKTYFGHERARVWFDDVAERVRAHEAIVSGAVELFVAPTYLQILPALSAFAGTPVLVASQDVCPAGPGSHTGEVTASELQEIGVSIAEVGHAERRRLYGETTEQTSSKARAALEAGLTPLICVGERKRMNPAAAAAAAVEQLSSIISGLPAGDVIVAYEPTWAIGAPAPADSVHVRCVAAALGRALQADDERAGSRVIYGGAAGPGMLSELDRCVDGLFLGRFAHDPQNLLRVLEEASRRAEATLGHRIEG